MCVVSIYGSYVSVLGCVDCTEVGECLVVVQRNRAAVAQQAWRAEVEEGGGGG